MQHYEHIQAANACIKACAECLDFCKKFMAVFKLGAKEPNFEKLRNQVIAQCQETMSQCRRCITACGAHLKECKNLVCCAACESTIQKCWDCIHACEQLGVHLAADEIDSIELCQALIDACNLCLQACDHCVETQC